MTTQLPYLTTRGHSGATEQPGGSVFPQLRLRVGYETVSLEKSTNPLVFWFGVSHYKYLLNIKFSENVEDSYTFCDLIQHVCV